MKTDLYERPNGYFYVSITDDTGKRKYVSLKTKSRREALKRFQNWTSYTKAQQGKLVRLSEAAAKFLAQAALRLEPSSLKNFTITLKHLQTFLRGDPHLGTITPDTMSDFQALRANLVKKSTVDQDLILCGTFFTWCKRRGWIPSNPASADSVPGWSRPVIEPVVGSSPTRNSRSCSTRPPHATRFS